MEDSMNLFKKQRVIFVTAVLLMSIPFIACSKTLDTSDIETQIKSGIEDQTGATIESVGCPDGVDVEAGATFDCTVKGAQGSGTVTVTQKDDQGNVTWELNP
jgi:hypothetical protein